jgi:hypothetical protein
MHVLDHAQLRGSGARRAARFGQRGQTLAEFALAVPLFLTVLLGLVDGGRFVYASNTLSQAAREGARTASVQASWVGSADPGCGTPSGPVCPPAVSGSNGLEANVLATTNRMVSGMGRITTVYVSCDAFGQQPTTALTSSSCTHRSPGDVVTVQVVFTFVPFTPVIGQLVPTVTRTASASMTIN